MNTAAPLIVLNQFELDHWVHYLHPNAYQSYCALCVWMQLAAHATPWN